MALRADHNKDCDLPGTAGGCGGFDIVSDCMSSGEWAAFTDTDTEEKLRDAA
jgi:hypothetical protein